MEKPTPEIVPIFDHIEENGVSSLLPEDRLESDVPKFPIERLEMKNHLLLRYPSRPNQENNPSTTFQSVASITEENSFPSNAFQEVMKTEKTSDVYFCVNEEGDDDDDDDMKMNLPDCPTNDFPSGKKLVDYQRMCILGSDTSEASVEDLQVAAISILKALEMRKKYMSASRQRNGSVASRYLRLARIGSKDILLPDMDRKYYTVHPPTDDHPINPPEVTGDPFFVNHWPKELPAMVHFQKGIARVDHVEVVSDIFTRMVDLPKFPDFSLETFIHDEKVMRQLVANGPLKSFTYRRLGFLSSKFSLHVLLNEGAESLEQKKVPHRDFYNIRKVDTHVHAASCMNQKHLLRFIKKCLRTRADELVSLDKITNLPITLKELVNQLGINAYDLNIDNLDVHADRNTFHRFDKFNSKYNPIGQSQLREVFLKTENFCNGSFFAHVIKEVFSDLEESKYQNAEPRLSIYGRSIKEWDDLASWAVNFKVYSPNVRWVIQVPRLYDIFKSQKVVESFQDMLVNIFQPLFEVTLDPKSHPQLHAFLNHVSAFDSVDDESKVDQIRFDYGIPTADLWNMPENPPYAYYIFYMYANLAVLNELRHHRRMHTFAFRPHCGEAGSVSHLIPAFLLAESINHGLLLRKAPVLQYLYYLCQIGLAMSPLSNNFLFLEYHRSPLNEFLARGLHVSLSTDDPLQFHFTKEPLMEEYSIAAQVWKLSSTDMCELAKNSVLISGFPDTVKSYWLGLDYKEEGVRGNDITRTNLPNIRAAYRHETLTHELQLLISAALEVHGVYPYGLLHGAPILLQSPRYIPSQHIEMSLLAGEDDVDNEKPFGLS